MSALIERTTAAIRNAYAARQPGDYSELDGIAAEISAIRAATPSEALLQACILCGEIDRAGDHERIERLAAGLVGYLERAAGIDRRDFGFDFFTDAARAV